MFWRYGELFPPQWGVAIGLAKIFDGLVSVLSLGFYGSNTYVGIVEYRMRLDLNHRMETEHETN